MDRQCGASPECPGDRGNPIQRVHGPALDFALLATRRRHRRDGSLVAEGPDADAWLDIVQAFAGRPGPGRSPLSKTV